MDQYEEDDFASVTSSINPILNEPIDHFFEFLDVLSFHNETLQRNPEKVKGKVWPKLKYKTV